MKARFAVARHGPNSGHVEHGHANADQHRNQQQTWRTRQALGQRQTDERVESKGNLRAGGVVAAGKMVFKTR